MPSSSVPPNAHVSAHPCLKAKVSQLRSASTNGRDTNALVREIATIVGVEALGSVLSSASSGTVCPTSHVADVIRLQRAID